MPYEEYLEFLDLLRKPMLFALDETPADGWSLSPDVFFEQICAEFDAEDEHGVAEALDSANKLVVIVAPPGGGKTTIIRKELRKMAIPPEQYFLFDFKEQIEKFYSMGKSPEDKLKFIRDQFKLEMARQFLAKIEDKVAFVYTALMLFFYEERMHRRIFMWRKAHNNPHIGETGAKKDALRTIFATDWEAVTEEEEFVKANLTCAQMAITVKRALNLPRFLLIIDNVDRLQVGAQPHLFSAAIDIHHGGRGEFGTVVAIRSKNLMRFEEAGSAGNIVRIVSLSQIVEEARPVRLHPPTPELARTVLEGRQTYAEKAVAATDDSGKFAEARSIFVRLAQLANDEFVADQLYNIANHSIKQMLVLNLDFVKYLFRLIGAKTIPYENGTLDLADWQVHSYLYRWLFARQTADHPFLLDVVTKFERYSAGTLDAAPECDIELVILAWLSRREVQFVRLSEVVRAFREIGIEPDSVITSLYRMYDVELLHRYLELSDSEEHVSLNYCRTENPRVTLNPLGFEFAANTITKFEFLHRCLLYSSSQSSSQDNLLERADTGIDSKIQAVVSHLREMQEAHVAAINQFASAAQHVSDFEAHYRREFCIGENFMLERIARSHLTFLKVQHHANFLAWREPYADILDALYEGIGSERRAKTTLSNLLVGK